MDGSDAVGASRPLQVTTMSYAAISVPITLRCSIAKLWRRSNVRIGLITSTVFATSADEEEARARRL
jgi:hypothetical protein